jgi:hypothetical protein
MGADDDLYGGYEQETMGGYEKSEFVKMLILLYFVFLYVLTRTYF